MNFNRDKKEPNVLFIVNVLSSTKAIRDLNNVCFADTGPNRGLTIYVCLCVWVPVSDNNSNGLNQAPKQLDDPDATLSFVIQVLLPASATIDTFKTYLPLFTQTFGELAPRVWFNHLSIEGTNNFISCGVSRKPGMPTGAHC